MSVFTTIALAFAPGCVQVPEAASAVTAPGPEARRQDFDAGRWGGVVIAQFVPQPNGRGLGISGHESLTLYNRGAVPVDLGGWSLREERGAGFEFPPGTWLAGQRFHVVDFAGGAVAATVPDSYETGVTVAFRPSGQPFADDFFRAGPSGGHSGCVALLDPEGRVHDTCLWWRAATPFPAGPLVEQVYREGQWREGDYVLNHLDPASGDVCFARRDVTAADANAQQSPGNPYGPRQWTVIGPSPGTDHAWVVAGSPLTEHRTLRGSVVFERREAEARSTPASGVALTLFLEQGGSLRARTDARGEFVFPLVPPGTHDLLAEKPGFAPAWNMAEKHPHWPAFASLVLRSLEAANTQTQTIDARGGILAGPDWSLEIPAGAVAAPTSFTATYLPPGLHPIVRDSLQRQPSGAGLLAVEAVGALVVEPSMSLARPATLRLRYTDTGTGAAAGERVLVESIAAGGAAERLADGTLQWQSQELWSVVPVAHFSTIATYRLIRLADGSPVVITYGGKTADVDGDGEVNVFDVELACAYGLCPGNCYEKTVTVSLMSTVSEGGSSTISGEAEAQTNAIMSLFMEGKVKIGGQVGRSWSNSTSSGREVSETIRLCYDLPTPSDSSQEKPDQETICAYMEFAVFRFHGGVRLENGKVVAFDANYFGTGFVPSGPRYVREVEPDHCP